MKTKKILALALAAVLLMAVTVGGTIAYLTAKTDAVTNTFAPTTVDVKVEEHNYDPTTGELTDTIISENQTESDYKLVPGVVMPKDPFVTVLKGSEEVFVYVEVTKSEGFDNYIDCDMAEGWTQIDDSNIWYWKKTVTTLNPAEDSDPIYILKGDSGDNAVCTDGIVTVNSNITLDGANGTVKMPTTNPTISFKAYVVQAATFDGDAEAAWNATYGK